MTRGSTDDAAAWKRAIVAAARELGFAHVGVCSAEPLERGATALRRWLSAGHHGAMAYMQAHARRHDPRALLDAAQSVVVVALAYGRGDGDEGPTVSRYARGADYHRVIKEKLFALAERCNGIVGRAVRARPVVDTAPLLERELALRAGLGFIGKSTMQILPRVGTYALLGELLTDLPLPPDAPSTADCGHCTACLDACPTDAFVAPYQLDARRCIAYLTIEQRHAIPTDLRVAVGERLFGCDVCQEVCPYNAGSAGREPAPELAPRPELERPDPLAWLNQGSAAHRRLVAGTALRRAGRAQLARNAAVTLGNGGDRAAVPSLCRALVEHRSELVRAHAAWALGALGGEAALAALRTSAASDPSPTVREEADAALARAT